MLDDLNLISKIDKTNMLDAVAGFPEQIKEAKEIVEHTHIPIILKIDNIIISGMGASAISGDIVQTLFRDKIDIPIYVNRQYNLPKWANKDTLVLSQSYSGNTEETLSTFKHAYQKHCKIIGISSGGKLQELCERRELPHIKIPAGIQPRAATGYILFSSIFLLKKIGVLTDDIESEINETIIVTEEFRNQNKKDIPKTSNISKQYAEKIFDKTPQVYGWGIYTPIARRWCTQFNENSKIVCRWDEIPECNHNDIVGWSMNPEVTKNFICILFRDSENETIYMSKRIDFMKKLFEDVAGGVIEVQVKGKKRLAKMMYAMYLGDFISCYLGILRNVDPTPVDAITELKNELAKI
ncbi:MAG: bifunctional phosphoglucose/phosphomannose isomerase [Thermoplasmata archaeon]|mgnify:CR=1 FL=1|nr:MAG: bifunctional phosphoglucose/phosphomannose isomerase [Thermoplasmata archaeon]